MATQKQAAMRSLHELINHVLQSGDALEPLTYTELARRIGRLKKDNTDGWGRGMGTILGVMGHFLQDLENEWREPIPQIQSLVVLKSGSLKGLPDNGIDEFWPDYPKLSKHEKTDRVRLEYERIKDFGNKWNKVVSILPKP